jgi:hypothetical protein
MAYDEARDRIVLFGGCESSCSAPSNETWEWDGSTWTQRFPTTSPPGQGVTELAYDAKRAVVVLLGWNNETWEWDGTTWKLVAPASTAFGFSYSGAPLAYDRARDRVVAVGGGGDGIETWEWDGSTWTMAAETAIPSWRVEHQLLYDPLRRRVVMYGGVDFQAMPDAWEWDGKAWAQVAVIPGAAREAPTWFYDNRGRRAVAFGGWGLVTRVGDTAALPYHSLTGVDETCLVATDDDDGDGLAGCADPDCWARCSPLCPPGSDCPPGAPQCGDGTCGPVEDHQICPSDCP